MAFSLSPSVDVREFELSLTVPNLPSSKTGTVIRSNTGPCLKIESITSENDLVTMFGKPNNDNYKDWFNAWNFLQYASSLYAVRPLPKYEVGGLFENCQNAGAKVSAEQSQMQSLAGIYNPDVAEQTFESETFAEKLHFFNKNITNVQDQAVAVCSSNYFWNSPICMDNNAVIDLTSNRVVVTGNKTIGIDNTTYTNNLSVGSQFISNDNKLYTVTSLTNNKTKIVLDADIVTWQLENYFGKTVTGSTSTLTFESGHNFVPGVVITSTDYPEFVTADNARVSVVVGNTVTFVKSGTESGIISFEVTGIPLTYISTNIFEKVATIGSSQVSGTKYIKVEPGFTYIPGDLITINDVEYNVTDVDYSTIYVNNIVTQAITADKNLLSVGEYFTDIQIAKVNIQAINGFDTKYDSSLIKKERVIVQTLKGSTWDDDTYYKQSLVAFSQLYDYVPDFTNNEFFIFVAKKNSFGKYQKAESFLVSYSPVGRDEQGKNIFIDSVFFNSSSEIYVKTGDETQPKVNTSRTTLITFGSADSSPDPTTYTFAHITKSDVQTAQDLFSDSETFDVNILLAHELDINGCSEIAETRKDCVAIVAPFEYQEFVSKTASVATGRMNELYGAQTVSTSKVFLRFGTYSAIYGNMKYQYDKFNDVNRWMPIGGDIAGLYAQTDIDRDPWWAPAGLERGKLKNVIKLAFNPNKQNRDDLYVNSINPVMSIPGEGAGIVFGQKTATARPSAFDRVNVRRLLVTIEKAIATAARYSLFEFNDTFTRNRLRGIIEPFLRTVKARRGLYDYLVVIDESNNTGQVIDSNALVVDIYLKPTKVAEFIQINAFVTRTDANFAEIVGKGP
jgi:hypothetical protein